MTYFDAFLSLFCETMRKDLPASVREEGAIPGMDFMNFLPPEAAFPLALPLFLELDMEVPAPPHAPQPGMVTSTSFGASASTSRCFASAND